MIRAYSELYVDDAMQTLAETFDYVSDGRQADMLFHDFIVSGAAEQFGRGNPRYLNMPSQVLFEEITGKRPPRKRAQFEKSPEYWCGFVLAYYQWFTGLRFEQIGRRLPLRGSSKCITLCMRRGWINSLMLQTGSFFIKRQI